MHKGIQCRHRRLGQGATRLSSRGWHEQARQAWKLTVDERPPVSVVAEAFRRGWRGRLRARSRHQIHLPVRRRLGRSTR